MNGQIGPVKRFGPPFGRDPMNRGYRAEKPLCRWDFAGFWPASGLRQSDLPVRRRPVRLWLRSKEGASEPLRRARQHGIRLRVNS